MVENDFYERMKALSFDKDVQKHLVKLDCWTKKRYGFVLKNVLRVEQKKLKGQLNFFEVKW